MTDSIEQASQRLDRVENAISDLVALSAKIEATQKAQGDDINKLANAVNRLTERSFDGSKANWGWIISGVSLLLFVGTLVVTNITQRIEDATMKHEKVVNILFDHVRDGHPFRVEQRIDAVNEVKERVQALERGDYDDGAALLKRIEKLEDRLLDK